MLIHQLFVTGSRQGRYSSGECEPRMVYSSSTFQQHISLWSIVSSCWIGQRPIHVLSTQWGAVCGSSCTGVMYNRATCVCVCVNWLEINKSKLILDYRQFEKFLVLRISAQHWKQRAHGGGCCGLCEKWTQAREGKKGSELRAVKQTEATRLGAFFDGSSAGESRMTPETQKLLVTF